MEVATVQQKLGKRLDPNAESPFVARTPEEAGYLKVAAFGVPGTGKTSLIITLLKMGYKVFVADCDFGGNGLRTVREYFKKVGRLDLLDNLTFFEFSDMVINGRKKTAADMFDTWLNDPGKMVVLVKGERIPLFEWDPDWFAWEGFSNFQQNMIEPQVLDMEATSKETSELRAAGLLAEQRDWDAIKRATNRPLDKFLRIHNPVTGKRINKLVTAHQGEAKEDKITGELTKGPLIQGSARHMFGAGFDLVINTVLLTDAKGQHYYYYVESGERAVKKRGFDLAGLVDEKKGRMDADSDKLLERLTGLPVPTLTSPVERVPKSE